MRAVAAPQTTVTASCRAMAIRPQRAITASRPSPYDDWMTRDTLFLVVSLIWVAMTVAGLAYVLLHE